MTFPTSSISPIAVIHTNFSTLIVATISTEALTMPLSTNMFVSFVRLHILINTLIPVFVNRKISISSTPIVIYIPKSLLDNLPDHT